MRFFTTARAPPPLPIPVHSIKRAAEKRRDSERKCETPGGGGEGERSPLDICSVRCWAQQLRVRREELRLSEDPVRTAGKFWPRRGRMF